MKAHYRWDKSARDWVPFAKVILRAGPSAPLVMPDLAPYRNVIDGKEIGGRRQHRDFLKAHGVVEIGSEFPKRTTPELDSPGPAIKQAIETLSNR